MMPVPDQPDDSSNSRPDPFTVPQFSKFYKPLIVQLNESSFQEIIQNFPKIVVLFRTIKSPEIFETFKALAQDLKRNHKVIFGIYNVSLEEATHIQKKNNLKRLPSIIFIEKTKKTNFFGSLDNQTELNNFLTDFLIKELIELKTHEDFLKFYNKPNQTKLLAIYQADMVKEKKLLEEMIKKELFEDSGPFVIGWTSDQSIIPIPSNVEMPSLILYNTFKEEDGEVIVTYEGNFKEGDNILSFCQLRSLPIVSEYNDDTSFRLFGGGVDTQMLLFLQEKMDNTLIIKEFKKAAKYNKEEELHYERIMFAIVYDQDENQEFLDFFGITSEQDLETPKVFLTKIDNRLQKLDKYLYEKDEINEEYIKDFIGEFRKKEIPRFFKSERVPDNTNKWPLNMVGSEFNKEVIRSKDNYFVLFCSNYQEQVCKGAAKYFEKISMKINENDREIVKFASFDIDKNEVLYLILAIKNFILKNILG